MEFRFASDGIPFDRKDVFGREALVPSWLSEDKQSLFLIHTGANSAGDGGDGHFAGSVVNQDTAVFEPFNVSHAGNHAGASAHQANVAYFDQAASQVAGTGGDGYSTASLGKVHILTRGGQRQGIDLATARRHQVRHI